ncbi:alginate O-acetyltransferase AlgX-related protein [Roseivivax isoporae]|uniref:AlgX/AlgJ SGNH hydrolase-like domain-containing protein n=1 Tax=Roseivivax isoporae LMG 25204 TaxID=1449351 RepID=X7F2A6_9RHOB|nr:hypothetical protein [Roseivivax isoporae]ETX26878.1 hypothetical protein RISW2_18760 [Roseivivax isoporae LMG 25204]
MTYRTLLLSIAACIAAAGGAAAQADSGAGSGFGCQGLQSADPMAALEGRDGVFYRLNLDMRNNHALSPQTASMMGAISDALAARGTTLIYVPVPTKSLAMPATLPAAAAGYGFDIGIAETVYRDFLATLEAHGVTTVDSMGAMRAAEGDPFLATDFHWSPDGARAVAGAVAEIIRAAPAYGDIEKTAYTTETGEMHQRYSEMRKRIQAHCAQSIPRVEMPYFETTAESAGDASGGIFAAEAAGPPIALTGTSMSAETDFHFEGFLADAAGAAVADYAITGGNQFGGITSYLLSEDYHDNPPAFVIWENPIYNNLGEFGETPLRELAAAAASSCRPLETSMPGPSRLVADIGADTLPRDGFVRVDTGAPTGRQAEFTFVDADGIEVSATISRPARYDATRWFYQYAAPLWSETLARVRVDLDQPARDGARLELCTTKDIQS